MLKGQCFNYQQSEKRPSICGIDDSVWNAANPEPACSSAGEERGGGTLPFRSREKSDSEAPLLFFSPAFRRGGRVRERKEENYPSPPTVKKEDASPSFSSAYQFPVGGKRKLHIACPTPPTPPRWLSVAARGPTATTVPLLLLLLYWCGTFLPLDERTKSIQRDWLPHEKSLIKWKRGLGRQTKIGRRRRSPPSPIHPQLRTRSRSVPPSLRRRIGEKNFFSCFGALARPSFMLDRGPCSIFPFLQVLLS